MVIYRDIFGLLLGTLHPFSFDVRFIKKGNVSVETLGHNLIQKWETQEKMQNYKGINVTPLPERNS